MEKSDNSFLKTADLNSLIRRYSLPCIISLIVGIILLFVPNASLVTLSVIVTIFLIVEGILFIVDGVRMKELKFDQTIDM